MKKIQDIAFAIHLRIAWFLQRTVLKNIIFQKYNELNAENQIHGFIHIVH